MQIHFNCCTYAMWGVDWWSERAIGQEETVDFCNLLSIVARAIGRVAWDEDVDE